RVGQYRLVARQDRVAGDAALAAGALRMPLRQEVAVVLHDPRVDGRIVGEAFRIDDPEPRHLRLADFARDQLRRIAVDLGVQRPDDAGLLGREGDAVRPLLETARRARV